MNTKPANFLQAVDFIMSRRNSTQTHISFGGGETEVETRPLEPEKVGQIWCNFGSLRGLLIQIYIRQNFVEFLFQSWYDGVCKGEGSYTTTVGTVTQVLDSFRRHTDTDRPTRRMYWRAMRGDRDAVKQIAS